ncbi:MAG: hypothetical protein II920_08520 [Clostridia bacterium]|nr:hypothetical protein [Clostridia bacterium]
MDIQKTITDLVSKISGDSSLLNKFKSNPLDTVKSLLGNIDLDSGALKSIVDGIKAKLNLEDTAKQATGFIAKIKAFFSKKK